MSSSISAQLQQLRSAATDVIADRLNQTSKATKKSLLYSERDAAKLDNNKLFELASAGIEELMSSQALEIAEEVFDAFFSERALSFQRLQCSKSENARISGFVKQYLTATQPLALHSATLHTIEWLIQRFYIEKFDTDALLWYFLPYFDQSVIFSKLSRLFHDIPDNWYWLLQPYRNEDGTNPNGSNLAFSSVIRFAHRDDSFIYNLGHQAKQAGGKGPLAVFFLKVATRCVMTCAAKDASQESLVAKIYPFVEESLSSKSALEWWKIGIMLASAMLARFSMDEEASVDLVARALKSSKPHESQSDAIMLFEVFATNQEHAVKRGFPEILKKRLQKVPGWLEIVIAHHEKLMRVKNRRLDDVFNLLSLDEELLETVYPRLAELGHLTSFVKAQKMKSCVVAPIELVSLQSGRLEERLRALEEGKYTQAELSNYFSIETDQKALEKAASLSDSTDALESALKHHYPAEISKSFAKRLTALNPPHAFFYQLFEKTAKDLTGRKFKPQNDDSTCGTIIAKVLALCQENAEKYTRLISLFLRCIRNEKCYSKNHQAQLISIFESLPVTPGGPGNEQQFCLEIMPEFRDSGADGELLVKNIEQCIQARVCKFLMSSSADMQQFFELIIPKDKFIFSMIVNNLQNKDRELALKQFRLLDTDSDFFGLALAVITSRGVLGRKNKELRVELTGILEGKGVLLEDLESIRAGAFQSYVDSEKDLVELLGSEFELLRHLSLRSFDRLQLSYTALCPLVEKQITTGDFTNLTAFQYVDLSSNMPLLFQTLAHTDRLTDELVARFLDIDLDATSIDALINELLSNQSPSHTVVKNIGKILSRHEIQARDIFNKVLKTPLKSADSGPVPSKIRVFLELCKILKNSKFSDQMVRFIMKIYESCQLSQDLMVVLDTVEHVLKKEDVISTVSDSVLRVDLLMKSLQQPNIAGNVHNAILQILTIVANRRPSCVLDHVITVLTSLSAIRVNDIHSVKICGETLEAIIPPLFASADNILITSDGNMLAASNRTEKRKLLSQGAKNATSFDIASKISKVIARTCKSMQNNAKHRKLQVLTSMNRSLGDLAWVLVAELVIQNNTHDATQELMVMMSTERVTATVRHLVEALRQGQFLKRPDIQSYAVFSRVLMNIVNNTLNHPEVVETMRGESGSAEFLASVLDLLQIVRREKQVDQKMEKLVLRCLQLMVILLPVNVLCTSIHTISSTSSVRTTLEKLAERLELISDTNTMSIIEVEQLIATFPECIKVLTAIVADQLKAVETLPSKQQSSRNKVAQLGIYALKSLTQIVCTTTQEESTRTHTAVLLNPLLPSMLAITTNPKVHRHVRASAMLCIAELTRYLENAFLPFLNKFVLTIQSFLVDSDQNQNKIAANTEDLICFSLKALQCLIQSVGHFLSPHLGNIMVTLGNLKSDTPLIQKRLRGVEALIATHIPMRVFFPTMSNCISKIKNPHSLVSLMRLTKAYLEKQSPVLVKAHLDAIRSWSQKMLSIREDFSAYGDCKSVAACEELEIEFSLAFCEFVKKLEESTFPQTFYKLFIWATDDFKNKPALAYSFYHLAGILAGQLKSTFVATVAVQMIGNIKDVLVWLADFRVLNKGKLNAIGMLEKVLGLVQEMSRYDRKEFVKTHLFDACGDTLIDLIAKSADIGGEEFTKNHLSPCIATMCLALSQSSQTSATLENMPMVSQTQTSTASHTLSCKTVHYKILQRTKYQQASVRKAAVQVVFDIAGKLGGDYSFLIPEAVPFFAELLEDDSEVVEEFTRNCLQKMEEFIGESMQQYF